MYKLDLLGPYYSYFGKKVFQKIEIYFFRLFEVYRFCGIYFCESNFFYNFAEFIFAIERIFFVFFGIYFCEKGQNRKNKFRKNFFRKNFFPQKFLPLRYFLWRHLFLRIKNFLQFCGIYFYD